MRINIDVSRCFATAKKVNNLNDQQQLNYRWLTIIEFYKILKIGSSMNI